MALVFLKVPHFLGLVYLCFPRLCILAAAVTLHGYTQQLHI